MNDVETQEGTSVRQAGRGTQIAAIIAACASSAVFLGLPVVIGQLAQLRGLTPDQLGEVASAETLGVALTATFGSWFIRRFKPKQLMVVGLQCLLVLQLLSATAWSYPAFILLRVGASLASGVVLPVSIAVLSRASNPERSFSWLVSSQIALSAIELFTFGPIANVLGMGGIYEALVLLCVLALMFLAPTTMPTLLEDGSASTQGRISPAIWVMVGAVFLFFCSIGANWAFIERAGAQAGMSPDEVGGPFPVSAATEIPSIFSHISLFRADKRLASPVQSRTGALLGRTCDLQSSDRLRGQLDRRLCRTACVGHFLAAISQGTSRSAASRLPRCCCAQSAFARERMGNIRAIS